MTKEFKQLKKRIDEITLNFSIVIEKYPKEINSRNQDLIKSFILLCHSELENYFESICIRVISKSKVLFDDNNIVTKPLLSLSLMSDKSFVERDKKFDTTQKRLDKLYSNYFATIKNNNGIKEDNLRKIFPAIGIDMNSIDDLLLSQLTAYGEKRGQIAHNTKGDIRRFKYEIQSINDLISSLGQLDKRFIK